MGPLGVLLDTRASASSVWKAVEAVLGPWAKGYEVETLAVELGRRNVPWVPSLSAKVLGAQTVLITRDWTFDHDVFFAFALACDGVPADPGSLHHPTPVQLAWAVREIEMLHNGEINSDEGFDPDTIDPAVAAILHTDGWAVPPDPLAFAAPALAKMDRSNGKLRALVLKRWPYLRDAEEAAARTAYWEEDDSDLKVQLGHLYDCELELRARARLRQEHHDACAQKS